MVDIEHILSDDDQPVWVCAPCGERYASGAARSRVATWHPDTCGVCGEETSCTEPRDFGYLRDDWTSHQRTEPET